LSYNYPLTIGLSRNLSGGERALGSLERVGDWPPDDISNIVPGSPALVVMCLTSYRLYEGPRSESILNHNVTITYLGAPAVKVEKFLISGLLLGVKLPQLCGR
jgi:hypothetical protein